MADAQVVINQKGPLPIAQTFQALSDGPALIMLSGSVWTQTPNTVLGINLSVDSVSAVAGTASIFANPTATHMAVVPIIIPYTFPQGEHKIYLTAANPETVSDFNDFYQVTILY